MFFIIDFFWVLFSFLVVMYVNVNLYLDVIGNDLNFFLFNCVMILL